MSDLQPDAPSPVLALTTPLSGGVVQVDAARFAWDGVPGADGYQLQVGAEATFETMVLSVDVGAATEQRLDDLLSPRSEVYYVRVQAYGGGQVTTSAPVPFVVVPPAPVVEEAAPAPTYVEGVDVAAEPEGFVTSAIFAAAGVVIVSVITIAVVLFQLTARQEYAQRTTFAVQAEYPELREVRVSASNLLENYEVLNAEDSTYRIPLNRAIDLMVNEAAQRPPRAYSSELQMRPRTQLVLEGGTTLPATTTDSVEASP
ncbi:MAG: hypothetical protein AAGI71_10710 [Bacteroidota bacterium]